MNHNKTYKMIACLLVMMIAAGFAAPIISLAAISPLPAALNAAHKGGTGSAPFIAAGGEYEAFYAHHGYSPGPEYAHRPQVTSKSVFSAIGAEDRQGGVECADTRNALGYTGLKPESYDSVFMFNLDKSAPGDIGFTITHLEYYNAVTRKTDDIDMKIVITGWDKDASLAYHYAYLNKSPALSTRMTGISEVTVREYYYVHSDTARFTTPYSVYTNLTITDIDARQYFGLKTLNGSMKNIYAEEDTALGYLKTNGYYCFRDLSGVLTNASMDNYNRYAAGYSYSSSAIEYAFGQAVANHTIYGVGQSALDMPSVRSVDVVFEKTVSDSDETGGKSNTLANAKEGFIYELTARIPSGMDKSQYFNKFEITDRIDSCLKIDAVRIRRNGANVVEGRFSTTVSGNDVKVAAAANTLADDWFYGGYGRDDMSYTVSLSVRLREDITDDSLREHGHFTVDGKMVKIPNEGVLTVDKDEQKDKAVTQIPVPDLEISKVCAEDEFQVGEDIPYTISVRHSPESGGTATDVTIEDTDFPEGLSIDPESLSISGVASAGKSVQAVKGGITVKIDELALGETAVITFTAKADKSLNGEMVANTARLTALGMREDKFDSELLYINSPKLEVTKSSKEGEVKLGEPIHYIADVRNINEGTFMRDVLFSDEITVSGINLLPESIALYRIDGPPSDSQPELTQIDPSKYELSVSGGKFSIRPKNPINLGWQVDPTVPASSATGKFDANTYKSLDLYYGIRIVYTAIATGEGLQNTEVKNVAISPSRENSKGEVVNEDPDIPSGGGNAEHGIAISGPKLILEKSSSLNEYSLGDTAQYTLHVTQSHEGHVAKNVSVSDRLDTNCAAIDPGSIRVKKGGADITSECAVNVTGPALFIETRQNLRFMETITVTYSVPLDDEALLDKTLKNKAEAWADNVPSEYADNEIKVLNPALLNIIKTPGAAVFKPGDIIGYQLNVTLDASSAADAENVVLEDRIQRAGATLVKESIAVMFNGNEITTSCAIEAGASGFRIETKRTLGKKDILEASYSVIADDDESLSDSPIGNVAVVNADNSPQAMDEAEVAPFDPLAEENIKAMEEAFNSMEARDNTGPGAKGHGLSPKTGDQFPLIGLIIVMAAVTTALIAFVIKRVRLSKK